MATATLYADGCDVCLDPATGRNVRCNLASVDGITRLLRPGDTRSLGPATVLPAAGCLALPAPVDALALLSRRIASPRGDHADWIRLPDGPDLPALVAAAHLHGLRAAVTVTRLPRRALACADLVTPYPVAASSRDPAPAAVIPRLAELAAHHPAPEMLGWAARVAAWHRAGTAVLATGDLTAELQWLVRGGLAPGEAIAAASTKARAVFAEDVGRIADGSPADWWLVPGGPLADIRALGRPRYVVAAGQLVEAGVDAQSSRQARTRSVRAAPFM